jgi:serine/threonine protein kinase
MDYLSGGDLRFHLCVRRCFDENQTRFFIACLISGLEYIHKKNLIHRDIKPENLVIDKEGYLRITDFGIARSWREQNYADTSGTPGYMAPEVMNRENHNYLVDYYAVGIIAYECMLGRRPYNGRSR